jgi:hypothetical protein
LVIVAFHLTDRFQFSKPCRDPRGEAMAGASGGRLSSRAFSAGNKRSGLGTDRRPASDFGLPSTSLPPTWVIERRTPNAPGLDIDIFYVRSGQLAEPQAGPPS